MANIVYRGSAIPSASNTTNGGVNRALTNDEIDKNFYALNALKLESESDTLATVTARGASTSTALTMSGNNILGAVGDTTTTTLYGSTYLPTSKAILKFGHTTDSFIDGSINRDPNNDFNIVYGGYYSGTGTTYTSNQSNAPATRIRMGLATYLGGNCFQFQRAVNIASGSISWTSLVSISSEGVLTCKGLTSSSDASITGSITATGDITSAYTSDVNLKTNMLSINDALNKVKTLDGITFNWSEEAQEKYKKDINVREAGVKAQQVQKVLPEVVVTREDGTLAVRYEQLVPLLIEAVKELSAKVEDLQNQLDNK